MRASVAAESAGIPSVSIVCEGFAGQARATARGVGYDELSIVATVGHVDTQTAALMIDNFVEHTVGAVIEGLIGGDHSTSGDAETVGEPAALDVVASGTVEAINEHFLTRGWSEGNVIIPPTRDRVERFVEPSGHDPWKTLGTAPSSGRDITIWSIAVNAVMAGCRPEHLPVLIAIAEVLADPRYGSEHSGNTTGADALVVLDGPCGVDLGFNAGAGAQREGVHANTAVGRWLRLYLRNVCGFTGDEHDKATFGNPVRPVLATDHACLTELGWPSVSRQLGSSSNDAVAMMRFNSSILIGSVFGSTPDEIVPYLANGLVRTAGWDLTHVFGLGHDQFAPLLVLSPLLARTFASAGWSLADVQRGLFEHARLPANRFEALIGEWTNLTAGRRRLVDLVAEGELPEVFAESDDPDRLVPIVTRPDRLFVTVAGDPNRANALAFSNDGPHGWWTTRPVDRTVATDLVCEI